MLGASPAKVWLTVDLPLVGPALAGAAAIAFAVALGEFGATSFLSRPENTTLPILIGRLITRPGPGNAGMAFAAGVVLALVCGAVVAAVDRFAGRAAAFGSLAMAADRAPDLLHDATQGRV